MVTGCSTVSKVEEESYLIGIITYNSGIILTFLNVMARLE